MRDERGVALLLALLTLFIVSLLVVALLQFSTIDLQIVSNHYLRNQALYRADAGVEYAISRLKNSKADFSSGNIYLPSGSGHFYNVTYSSSSSRITSGGTLASGEQVSLEAEVSVTGASAPYQVKILRWREL